MNTQRTADKTHDAKEAVIKVRDESPAACVTHKKEPGEKCGAAHGYTSDATMALLK